jgi:hypothetical protein
MSARSRIPVDHLWLHWYILPPLRETVFDSAYGRFSPTHSVHKAETFNKRSLIKSVTRAITAGCSILDQESSHHAVGSATEPNIMQKHAMALGYFFLAVFCIFTSSQDLPLQIPLLVVAMLAALMGIGFLMSAWAAQFQTAWRWWLQVVRLGQKGTNPWSSSVD